MSGINVIDLFCGTGGFAHGFLMHERNFRLVYAIDSNPYATQTAQANHPLCRVDTRDIQDVSVQRLDAELGRPQIDLIIGGPPCQGFSSLRPNRASNNNDQRNSLFLSFARFVEHFRPKCFVLENVVGLVTHNRGSTLRHVCNAFSQLGYSSDWRILNAAHYGVPQKRERFILIGRRDGQAIAFPTPTHFYDGRVIGYRDKRRHVVGSPDKPAALTVNDAIDDLPPLQRGERANHYSRAPGNAYQRLLRGQKQTLTLHKAANHSDKMLEVIKHAGDNIKCIPPHLITSGFSSCYSRLRPDAPSTTITVKFQSPASNKCIHPVQDRTITPREAARIQSFPDAYAFCGSLTQIAAQLGNAVPPVLGMAVSKPVLEMIDCQRETAARYRGER